ncbi:MAG: peptide-methionine (R)-S-oxide reductase MsrB [Pseudomonadota bacterium]
MSDPQRKSDAEWREILSPEQYRILREKGTERPFSHQGFEPGVRTFMCAGCGAPLFEKDAKFDSGSGWPSFTRPIAEDAVAEELDVSHGMRRTEVLCARCGGHLGHVFPDGPGPEGLRYCINGMALSGEAEDPA